LRVAADPAVDLHGTPNVRVGDATVTFPGRVTDAAFSPDGRRVAYIDANGSVATAKPDGTDVFVLTRTKASVTRSRPTWWESQLRGMGFTNIVPLPAGAAPQPTARVCGPQGNGDLFDQWVAVVDAADPIAVSLAGDFTTTVIAASGGAPTQDRITFCSTAHACWGRRT
jgi:hypothetical protein